MPTPIPIPNLNRLYFKIAPPIDTTALNLNLKDTEAVGALYGQVRQSVEQVRVCDIQTHTHTHTHTHTPTYAVTQRQRAREGDDHAAYSMQ